MPFERSDDIERAAWWIEALGPFAKDVGSVVPDVFEAYARVFHPVTDEEDTRRAWAEVAAENGRIPHPEMQLHEIGRPLGTTRPSQYDPNDWINRVAWGSLPREELVAMRDVLTLETSTPDECWCCVWEGYGHLQDDTLASRRGAHSAPGRVSLPAPREELDGRRVSVPGRSYHLLGGPLSELPDLFDLLGCQSPNIWWPDDQAWLVATEIDFAWTYVGGSTAAIDGLLADPRLEALPAKVTDRFTYDSDLVNAALDVE